MLIFSPIWHVLLLVDEMHPRELVATLHISVGFGRINVSPLNQFNSVCRSSQCCNPITIWLRAFFNKEVLRQTELILNQNNLAIGLLHISTALYEIYCYNLNGIHIIIYRGFLGTIALGFNTFIWCYVVFVSSISI